ncbi:MAG: carboxylating nicotinate-nucleotide diphosphorylase [Planctomycetes bacterium]|nr:carboxylating nicotinate-nucleotide diphosphorylase [Planctomycetota bacterium]
MKFAPDEREFENLKQLLEAARREDLGDGDVTSALLGVDVDVCGKFVARENLCVCGAAFLETIAGAYDEQIVTKVHVAEGAAAKAGDVLAEWSGPATAILAGERVALNFLQRLSGIATTTRAYAEKTYDSGADLCDTRKTTPGWRFLEKYAVRCGGGANHRMGLYDAVLVKDNHLAVLAAAGRKDPLADIAKGFEAARLTFGVTGFIEVEVDTLEQLEVAMGLDVNLVLLDNMTVEQLEQAVAMRDARGLRAIVDLEASGGITLDNVREIALTGVERVAVGALTHSAVAVDIALDIRPA